MSQLAMFSGATFDPALDGERLNTQLHRVYDVLRDHAWHTLPELREKCGGSDAALSARIRDLRKPRFGFHTIESRRVREGLWVYRLML